MDSIGARALSIPTRKLILRYLYLLTFSNSIFSLSSTFIILFFIDTVGYEEAGLLFAIGFFIQAAFDYPTGTLGDRIGQRFVLVMAFFGYSIAFTVFSFADSFYMLTIGYSVFSLAAAQQSGAFESWFDNQYKIASKHEDTDRTSYRMVMAKSRIVIDLVGGLMLIVGGIISTQYNRQLVFKIQAYGMVIVCVLVLIYVKEIHQGKINEKIPYFTLLKGGITSVVENKVVLTLVIATVLHQATTVVFGSLLLFPIYFGYTGSDFGASIFRFSLFISGSFTVWLSADIFKNANIPKVLPRIQIIHSFLFYGGCAVLIKFNPLNDVLDIYAAVYIGLIILITHTMRVIVYIFLQRIYLDLIDDERRNGFYSLIPTLVLLFSSPLALLSGYVGENYGYSALLIILGIISLIGTGLYYMGMQLLKEQEELQSYLDQSIPDIY
ncbi:MAG: MFS transporter [Candidatus Kariarchaeaceae archaeon]